MPRLSSLEMNGLDDQATSHLLPASTNNMSYYFSIIGTRDNPLFEIDFGTSKIGGDGVARFREEAKHMNQFIVHSALDVVEDAQWNTKDL